MQWRKRMRSALVRTRFGSSVSERIQYAPRDFTGDMPEHQLLTAPYARSLSQHPSKLFSVAAFHHAWHSVKRAKGGAGVDRVTLEQFEANLQEEIGMLRAEMVSGQYRPRPLRQVLVPKRDEGLRTLVVWALRDRVAQRVVYDLISPVFEREFLACSFGFRSGLGVDDAVQRLLVLRDRKLRWVVDADIEHCFDSMHSGYLRRLVRRRIRNRLILAHIRRWLDAELLTSADGQPRSAGAAQGGVLSPLFANIYLHEMDRRLTAQNLALVRYADDFVICCRRKADAQTAHAAAGEALGRLGLRLHPYKTQITHFDEGFSWLGYFFIRNEHYRL